MEKGKLDEKKKNEYYNTRELDNNEENERRSESRSREDLRMRDNRYDERYARDPTRDIRGDRDMIRDPYQPRDRDYRPRGDYRDHKPRGFFSRGPRQKSYNEMFNNRFGAFGSHPSSRPSYDRFPEPSHHFRRY